MTLKDIEQRNFSWLQLDSWPFGERIILTEQAKHRLACLYGFAYGASLIRKEFAEKLIADFHARIEHWIKRSLGENKVPRFKSETLPAINTYPENICRLSDDGSFLSFCFEYRAIIQVDNPGAPIPGSHNAYFADFYNGKQIMYRPWMHGGLIYHGPKTRDDIMNDKLDSSYNYWGMHT